jgi:Protein of unknown function (DUF938)
MSQPFVLPVLSEPALDARLSAPATRRNLDPIRTLLMAHAPRTGRALELAAGTGEHALAFSHAFPDLTWQPTDIDPARLASIAAWAALCGPDSLADPIPLDASSPGWSNTYGPVEMILLVNLLHLISDAKAAIVLSEIALALAPGGSAFLYGPFLREGRATSDGDARFHTSLRAQDAATGYKDLDWVQDHLRPLTISVVKMPANNLMLFARASA